MITIKKNGNPFLTFFVKQYDCKLLLTGNLKQADVAGLNIQDSFTKKVIEIWSNLTYDETASTLWQRASLVQLPYKNCKPAYFLFGLGSRGGLLGKRPARSKV